jgi:hypothetical protein
MIPVSEGVLKGSGNGFTKRIKCRKNMGFSSVSSAFIRCQHPHCDFSNTLSDTSIYFRIFQTHLSIVRTVFGAGLETGTAPGALALTLFFKEISSNENTHLRCVTLRFSDMPERLYGTLRQVYCFLEISSCRRR